MRWKRMALRLGLIAMIVLSFYLSYLIWLNPSNKTGLDTTQSGDTTTEKEVSSRSMADVFLPLKLVSVTKGNAQETSSEVVIKKVLKKIEETKMSNPKLMEYTTDAEFEANHQLTDGLELTLMNEMSLAECIELLNLRLTLNQSLTDKDLTFDHAQIDYKTATFRFLNSKKHYIVTVAFDGDFDKIKSLLAENEASWYSVVLDSSLISSQYVTNKPIELKLYSYISSVQSFTLFRDSFFTNPSDAKSSDDSSDLMIVDQSEIMTVQTQDSLVEFRDTNITNIDDNLYKASYQYIRYLGTNYGNLRFMNRNGNTIDYRVFVEGYPVFSTNKEGLVTTSFSKNRQSDSWSVSIDANMNTIQVPIPSDQTVQIPASQTVLEELKSQGADLTKLTAFVIGYKWNDIKDTGVVDLVPTWYVNYDKHWQESDTLLKQFEESEDD